ncbi:ABC transporter substrate-binding protein [Paracoccus actinidiae]|uniref:ABC transporter substrate-binding protein n=1 Tax=Paracoccus actinidiae TaxID=3064531 RepID=UPI0027D2BF17|nr:extracellular solute-binding protein [Paracoccus sp. M09]
MTLKGMTWNHPRGYDPMVACSAIWAERTGVRIEWDQRSLQDFESYPVEDLARAYDLIVIDHPHVGQITRENCLVPLDVPEREAELAALAQGTVGPSFPSYEWQGRQWGFPIDAASQVLAWRPDLLERAPATWDQIMELAREGRVMLPLRPPHSLMCLYSLAGNLGTPCAVTGDRLIDPQAGAKVWQMLRELADLVDLACATMDPIAVFEEMARPGSRIACVPLIYCYVSYAISGFRPNLVRFADMPVAGSNGPVGSALGGTGIAVSAFSDHRQAAMDFAYWIAGPEAQTGPYSASGGQPGLAAAWEDDRVNAVTSNTYRATRATYEGAWLRPRHDGGMAFQQSAAQRVTDGLVAREDAGPVIDDINRMFRDSF